MSRVTRALRSPSAMQWLPHVAIGSLAFLVYAVTLTPGAPPTDSGELIVAAWLPGIAHAPGFPLYILAGWLWTHLLPVGRVAWRLNLFSAACSGAAAALLSALAAGSLGRAYPLQPARLAIAAAASAAGALAFGRTVWGWSTAAEVYALGLAVSAAVLFLVAGREAATQPHDAIVAARAPLVAAAFLFGLGLGAHLTSLALLAPAVGVWLTSRYGWRIWRSRTTGWMCLAAVAGAAVYIYLPLRAAADPLLNWGAPDSWQRFWWHVTARQYRVSLFSAPIGPQITLAGRLWWAQFTPLGLGLIAYGAWRSARRDRALFWCLLTIIALSMLYAWAYVIEDDQDAYYLPAFLAGSIWLAWGIHGAVLRLAARLRAAWRPAAGLLAVLAPLLALVLNWGACDRHADTIPEDYARDALAEIGPGGVLLTRDWQLYSPALYLQIVEDLRRDVTLIDTELLRRDWYFGLLHRWDPGLMTAVATEERAFRTLRDAWERGEIADDDPRIEELQTAYVNLLNALVDRAQDAARPVHAGPNRGVEGMRAATLQGQPDMEPGVGAIWSWIPAGLSFRALPQGALPESGPTLDWRVAAFERVQPSQPERKIQATRADMAALHGLLQAQLGNLAGAEADWRLALAVEPGHWAASRLLGQLESLR